MMCQLLLTDWEHNNYRKRTHSNALSDFVPFCLIVSSSCLCNPVSFSSRSAHFRHGQPLSFRATKMRNMSPWILYICQINIHLGSIPSISIPFCVQCCKFTGYNSSKVSKYYRQMYKKKYNCKNCSYENVRYIKLA